MRERHIRDLIAQGLICPDEAVDDHGKTLVRMGVKLTGSKDCPPKYTGWLLPPGWELKEQAGGHWHIYDARNRHRVTLAYTRGTIPRLLLHQRYSFEIHWDTKRGTHTIEMWDSHARSWTQVQDLPASARTNGQRDKALADCAAQHRPNWKDPAMYWSDPVSAEAAA